MLKITGYADRLYCRPGDTVRFMVNCELASYHAELVRIICADDNPHGPGVKEEVIDSSMSGQYRGRRQLIHAGSCVVVGAGAALQALRSFTLQAFIWPTTPLMGRQGLISKWSAKDKAGFALIIDEQGCAALMMGGGGKLDLLSTGRALQRRRWYRVAASFDADSAIVRVLQEPLAPVPGIDDQACSERLTALVPPPTAAAVIFAAIAADIPAGPQFQAHYNGKIDSPRIAARALTDAECVAITAPMIARTIPGLLGAWDFSVGMSSQTAFDRSPNRLHGQIVNFPARAMTGWNWSGEDMDWKQNPSQWGAIHFHDDDLYDAGWEADFELAIPATMKSGIYAARLRAARQGVQERADEEEYIWFAVGPTPGHEKQLALLLPTASYMAYANDHFGTDGTDNELLNNILTVLSPHDLFLNEHREYGGSLYDLHADGSGVCYSSRLRPVVNMRPKRQNVLAGFGHSRLWQFAADTHITDWLEAMGHEYDVITDEELHDRGLELLSCYRVIVTGSHPEYYSGEMWQALSSYRDRGGRLMYLGGNGFYWRIAYHREVPGIIELRRAESGVRAWAALPGEYYHSFDGRQGGLWVRQGRAPQSLTGVGFAAQGFDVSSYYQRLPDSLKPEVAFIFEGVGEAERIGDFGLIAGGAAGLELDRAEPELGTPPNCLILASSVGHTDTYVLVPEEFLETSLGLGGRENAKVRADMVYFRTLGGGAVFSVGSIAWAGSLAHASYTNNVSRITDNVLRRFLDATTAITAAPARDQNPDKPSAA
jgi:N,N-dimethylformamidase